jgi:predicted enzyme related to lactoylglutathione lyase
VEPILFQGEEIGCGYLGHRHVVLEPFYEDIHAAKSFYEDVFGLTAVDVDETSALFCSTDGWSS